MTAMTEAELFRAHSAGPASDPVRMPQPHELRRAWQTTKTLEEQLEVADQPVLRRVALHIRESLFLELMALEGYVEVPLVGAFSDRQAEVMPDPA